MTKFFLIPFFACSSLISIGQTVSVRGKIRCMNPTPQTTKGAESVVVVPTFAPARSSITSSYPTGYFEINTGLSFKKLEDKTIVLHVVSKCADCKESIRRVFISADQNKVDANGQKSYTTVRDWLLKSTCPQVELPSSKADSIVNVIVQQGGRDLNYMPTASVLTGTPALLNLLTTLTAVAGGGGIANIHYGIQTLKPGNINYGDFLNASSMYHTTNTGFNFSPSRDMSESIFWNAAAMSFSKKSGNISLLTNVKNFGKLGGFYKLSNKFSLGAGLIFTTQDEFRKTVFEQGSFIRFEDSMPMQLTEYVANIAASYKFNTHLSGGLSVKYIHQSFNNPDSLFCDAQGKGTFVDEQINNQKMDIDISALYHISSSLQAGISLMNLLGSQLNSDAYSSYYYNAKKPWQQLRSAGIGLTYKYRRFNAGIDLLFANNNLYDASFGLNFVPFNNALISGGINVKQLSYSLSFRLKHFRIGYINDNDYLVNQKRIGKSSILHGKICGGFIVDLN